MDRTQAFDAALEKLRGTEFGSAEVLQHMQENENLPREELAKLSPQWVGGELARRAKDKANEVQSAGDDSSKRYTLPAPPKPPQDSTKGGLGDSSPPGPLFGDPSKFPPHEEAPEDDEGSEWWQENADQLESAIKKILAHQGQIGDAGYGDKARLQGFAMDYHHSDLQKLAAEDAENFSALLELSDQLIESFKLLTRTIAVKLLRLVRAAPDKLMINGLVSGNICEDEAKARTFLAAMKNWQVNQVFKNFDRATAEDWIGYLEAAGVKIPSQKRQPLVRKRRVVGRLGRLPPPPSEGGRQSGAPSRARSRTVPRPQREEADRPKSDLPVLPASDFDDCLAQDVDELNQAVAADKKRQEQAGGQDAAQEGLPQAQPESTPPTQSGAPAADAESAKAETEAVPQDTQEAPSPEVRQERESIGNAQLPDLLRNFKVELALFGVVALLLALLRWVGAF